MTYRKSETRDRDASFCSRCARFTLAGVLTIAMFSPAAAAGLRIEESADPVETQEQERAEDVGVWGMRRCGIRTVRSAAPPKRPIFCGVAVRPSSGVPFASGHRLMNGLLAPLTC